MMANESKPLEHYTGDTSFFGHPRGLSTLFFTEMWERFSFYGLRPLLVLFMAAALADGGFGFERTQASAIVGIYAASVYLFSLPGGWIADRWLGLRRAVYYGAVLIALGHLSIGLASFMHARLPFFLGLILIVLGTGLLKPNISATVGELYTDKGAKRDAGFSIFYMGINTGAFAGQLVTGALGEKLGWHWGFGAAGVGMLIGVIYFKLRSPGTLGPVGAEPARHADPVKQASQERTVKVAIGVFLAALLAVIVMAASGAVTLEPRSIGEKMTVVLVGVGIAYFAYIFIAGGLSRDEMKRMGVIVLLFIFSAIFWGAFEQAPTSLNLFANDFTDRNIGGFEMPATWFQSINSAFIILLAPVFAVVWVWLARRGMDFSSPTKFAMGLAFTAFGFLLMYWAANAVLASGGALKVSPWWLVGSYFFQSVGELCISPVGLSSMTTLAPRKFVGQMMGVWFLATSVGNLVAGLVGGHVDPGKLEQTPMVFSGTTIALVGAAVVLALLIIPARRLMGESKAA
jgi:POT family proton-dependent oligopeptide transporter